MGWFQRWWVEGKGDGGRGGGGVQSVMARPALGSSSPLTRCRWFMARSKASRTAFRMREEGASFSLILSSVWLIPKGAILDLGSHCLKREKKEKTEFSVSCFRLHQWPHSLCSAYSLTCPVDGDDSLSSEHCQLNSEMDTMSGFPLFPTVSWFSTLWLNKQLLINCYLNNQTKVKAIETLQQQTVDTRDE